MNRRQKALLIEAIFVIALTITAVAAMLNLRDYINRRQAKLALTVLGNRIKKYRAKYGLVPPQAWVDGQRETLPGNVRLGQLHYRARWIDADSDPNEILAFAFKKSRSLILKDGYLLLKLKEVLTPDLNTNVNVQWMDKEHFEALLARQQSPLEIQIRGR